MYAIIINKFLPYDKTRIYIIDAIQAIYREIKDGISIYTSLSIFFSM